MMDKEKAIRAAKLTAGAVFEKNRAKTAVTRAGGQIAPSKYLPNVPRAVHADGGRVGYEDGGTIGGTEPKNTVKAYKLFKRKKDGNIYPLFVNANKPVPIGQWLDAEEGTQGKSEGKVKSSIGDLAYRPGWHAGDLPVATHIGGKSRKELTAPDYRPDDHVWAEVEMPNDVDWQSVANSRMRRTADGKPILNTAHITDQLPKGGFYRYKTNPNMTGNWLIGGSMKVNRILHDDEVKQINDAAGTADLPRMHDITKAGGGAVLPKGYSLKVDKDKLGVLAHYNGQPVGQLTLMRDRDSGDLTAFQMAVHPKHQRKGLMSAMHDAAEEAFGPMQPDKTLTDDGFAFWKGYRPDAVSNNLRFHTEKLMGQTVKTPYGPGTVKSVGSTGMNAELESGNTGWARASDNEDVLRGLGIDPSTIKYASGGRIARAPGGYVPQASIAYKSLPVGQAPAVGGGTSLGDFAQMASMMGGKEEAAAPHPQHHQNDGHDHSGMSDVALQAWNKLTDAYGQPLTIVSGYRDPQQNEAAGGAKGSQHLHGNAYDIDTSGMSHEDRLALATQAYNSGFRGFGFYDNNMHFDVGDQRAWGPSYSSDSIPEWAQPFVQQYVARAAGGKVYPTADRSEWYGDANYQSTGGQIEHMSPDEYLSKVRPLDIDEASRDNIDDLKNHIMSGRKLDPLKIDAKGREDGRHRAHAAKELGIKSVPVLTWPRSARANGGPVTDNENFQSWFGNSVTHTDGEPHVFYTGTSKDKDFTAFNVGRHGAWFVRDPEVASSYADQNDSQGYKWEGGRPIRTNTASRVIPAYIKAENPYTGEYSGATTGNYKSDQSNWFDTLRAKGHDAWIPASSQGKLAVVLREPQQIKSIYNNGKFDPNQKHMGKAEGGRTGYGDGGMPQQNGDAVQMEEPANGMHMLRMRRAGINTKEDFWNRWRDHMRAKAGPNPALSMIGSKDGHFKQIDNMLKFSRETADQNGIRSVLQRYGQNREDGSMAASMPRAILQNAGIDPTIDNASKIYHSLPDDESGRIGFGTGGMPQQNGEQNVGTEVAPNDIATRPQAGGLPITGGVRGGSGVLQTQNEAPLEGLPTKVGIPFSGGSITAGPDPRIRQVARDYMAQAGLPYNPPTKYAKVDPKRAARIASSYEDMKDDHRDPLTKASYDAMIRETMAQYKAAKDAGFKAEFWHPDKQEDPYKASPRLATEDVRNNHHMWVYPTYAGYGSGDPISEDDAKKNPLLQLTGETWNGIPVTVNDVFRAVHDYYGHAKEGVGFRGDGEENAWRAHASMFSPLARMAMTSETRGQNSWLNYGPHGEKNRTARTEDTIFAPQKIGIMDHSAHHDGAEDFMNPDEIEEMAAIRKRYGRSTGGAVDAALALTRRFTKNGIGATMTLKPRGK